MSNTPKFEWTDELVKEFAKLFNLRKDVRMPEELLTEFKRTHQRIEVNNFYSDEVMFGKNDVKPYYHFNLKSSFIPQHKVPAIKQAIEQVLNNDTPDNQSKEGKCVFDTDMINERIKHIAELEEAFNAGRELWADEFAPPAHQLRYREFRDYCIEKSPSYLKPQWNPPPKTDTVVEDKGFIGVEVFGLGKEGADATIRVHNMNHAIPIKKMVGIKILVQNFLSNYFRVHADNTWSVHSEGQKTFTQSEVDAIREETWKAAREYKEDNDGRSKLYHTFEDYLNTLNPDNKPYTGKDSKVDWEILEGHNINDGVHKWGNNPQNVGKGGTTCSQQNCTIHSVKRLSDNTVFSVRDGWDNGYSITSFKIIRGEMMYEVNGNDCFYNINSLRPPINAHKETEPNQPENISTDNSDVACLSLNDLLEVWDERGIDSKSHNGKLSLMYKRFEQKAKQKLKTHTP